MSGEKKQATKTNSIMDGFREYSDSFDLLAPIIYFGVYVYILDRIFGGKIYFMITGVFVGFILVNIAIYRKMKIILDKYSQEENKKENKDK